MKLKSASLSLVLVFLMNAAFSQKSVRDSLKTFTVNLVNKAMKKGVKKMAIWDFTDLNKETSTFGSYIAEQFSVYAGDLEGLELMDRQNLKSLLNEHKLKSEGFIDQNTIMQLGKLHDVEAVVVGSVIMANNDFQVVVKIIETNFGRTIAAGEEFFQIDKKIAAILGMDFSENNSPVKNKDDVQSKIEGTWAGDLSQKNQPSSFSMLMQVSLVADKITGTIQINDKVNQLVFAKFSVEGIYEKGKFKITDLAVKDLYGNHQLCMKNYTGVIKQNGKDLIFSGTWDNDSYKIYNFGKIDITPVKCEGGIFSVKKISN